ncbi:MAG: formyltetrahydrofolate deformylase [Phycisphaerae bacterium]
MSANTIHLLIACPDKRGIIAAVAAFIAQFDGNILDADQHVDPEHGEFFMRVEIEPGRFRLDRHTFAAAWRSLADNFDMRWQIHWGGVRRMAIFVSRASHCLVDLLWRHRHREMEVDIPLVISNHPDLRDVVEAHGIAYHCLAIPANDKLKQEAEALALLEDAGVDFIVLARYMQILTPGFLSHFPDRIINIHHSFLPAFSGAQPYRQAFARGVKIIGATSHYVTEDLDDGPIIAQRTLAVDHRDSVADMVRKGRDLERVVLATAVRLQLESRILTSRNKTIVFE